MRYSIQGGTPIFGSVRVSGAKNFSIKALSGSLLTRSPVTFYNVPNNLDVFNTLSMLESAGVVVAWNQEQRICTIDSSNAQNIIISKHSNMATYLLGAAMIHRFDSVTFPKTKGCSLGMRSDDFHLDAFRKFGATCIDIDHAYLLTKNQRLKGTHIHLPYPSVGATETALFLAICAEGITHISNAAIEPEIIALITMLVSMGARIYFEDDRSIVVYGVESLHSASVFIHGDLLEVATWAVLAGVTNGEISVEGFVPESVGSFLGIFTMLGGTIERNSETSLKFSKKNLASVAVVLETGVFPQLRTDLQPLIAAMAATNSNTTIIHETVYDKRLDYLESFPQFGISVSAVYDCLGRKCRFDHKTLHNIIIHGGPQLMTPKEIITAKTIRSGMAEIILSIAVAGKVVIDQVDIVERGYCSLFEKLRNLGVNVERSE